MTTKTDRIRFVCGQCGYRARIPAKYNGQTIACPGCQKPQEVTPADDQPATGQTAEFRKEDAPTAENDGKFRFVCDECSYRARIPVKYAGMAIKCPGCGKPKMADQQGAAEAATGGTVEIRKVDLSGGGDRFLFQCGECGYRARLPTSYEGQQIKCPGCSAPQAATAASPGPSTGNTVTMDKVDAPKAQPVPTATPVRNDAAGLDLASADEPIGLDEAPAAAGATTESDEEPGTDLFADEPPAATDEPAEPAAPARASTPVGNDDPADLLQQIKRDSQRQRAIRQASDRQQAAAEAEAAKPKPKSKPTPKRPQASGADSGSGGGSKGPVVVMSLLALLFAGAAVFLFWQWQQTSQELTATSERLESTENELADTSSRLETTTASLASTRDELGTATERLSAETTAHQTTTEELQQARITIGLREERIETLTTELGEQRARVTELVSERDRLQRSLDQLQQQLATIRSAAAEADDLPTPLVQALEAVAPAGE